MALRRRVLDLLAQLPEPDPRALHALGDSLAINEPQTLATFIDAGGLGAGIVAGIGLNRPVVSITFGILTAVLALLADWVGLVIEQVLRPRGL